MTFRLSQANIGRVENQDNPNDTPMVAGTVGSSGFSSVAPVDPKSDDSENAALLGREQADSTPAPIEEASNRIPKATEESPEEIAHLEFQIKGPQQFGTTNVIIWQLPKNPATDDEENSTDEVN